MPNRTSLYDWHVAQGARMVDFAGWDMPVQYESIVEEHQAVRTAAGVFDISHMGRLWLSGTRGVDLVQKLFTNDAATLKEGQIRYGLVCNDNGGILDDVLVYGSPDSRDMVVNASNQEKILSWTERHHGPGTAALQHRTRTPIHSTRASGGPVSWIRQICWVEGHWSSARRTSLGRGGPAWSWKANALLAKAPPW